jgi:hypothetical protein
VLDKIKSTESLLQESYIASPPAHEPILKRWLHLLTELELFEAKADKVKEA